MTHQDIIAVIDSIADNSSELKTVAALRKAQSDLRRLEEIRLEHEAGAVKTIGGQSIYADIRGRRLHRLLYGDLDGN